MFHPTHSILLAALALGVGAAEGQTESSLSTSPPPAAGPVERPEYGGIASAQTITNLGYFFHAKFSEAWNTQVNNDRYVLLVKERQSPRGGTEMQVITGDQVVFRGILPRTYPATAALAEASAEAVTQNLVQASLQETLFNDPDMSRSGY